MALIGFVSAKRLQGKLVSSWKVDGELRTGEIGISVDRDSVTKKRILTLCVLNTGELFLFPLRRKPRMPKSVGIPTVQIKTERGQS